MSFKVHLIIVCLIIVAVYLAWQNMNTAPAPVVKPVVTSSAQYVITVTHASWGLNCNRIAITNGTTQSDPFAASDGAVKIQPDNILVGVTNLCNGKDQCTILNDPDNMGEDPVPDCHPKNIDIEYRCFSYDRPRFISTSMRNVVLHCTAPQTGAIPISSPTSTAP